MIIPILLMLQVSGCVRVLVCSRLFCYLAEKAVGFRFWVERPLAGSPAKPALGDGRTATRKPKRPLTSEDEQSDPDTPLWLKAIVEDKIPKVQKGRVEANEKTSKLAVPVPRGGDEVLFSRTFSRSIAPRRDSREHTKEKRSRKDHYSRRRRRRSSSSKSRSPSDGESTSHSATQVFREATKTRNKSSQESLMRYSRRYLGRLACATMQSWHQMSAKTGRRHKYTSTVVPACTKRFFQ